MYLDAPYLGQAGNLSICGFEAAARHYWGKSAKDLTLGEAATWRVFSPLRVGTDPTSRRSWPNFAGIVFCVAWK